MVAASNELVRENILRLARKLPTSPKIFGRLGRLLTDVNAELDDVVKLVSVDAGLTSRVIRVSNSIFFRGSEPVTSLNEAINRLGFREMYKMVGVAVSDQIFQSGLPVYNLTAEEVWENSVTTALAMERLARAAGEDEGLAYTLGLLRPVGKVVLDVLLEVEHPGVSCPESETLELPKWERAWAAITSNEAGAMILEDWKMPEQVQNSVLCHYHPDEQSSRLASLLHVACWVTHQLGKGMKVETRQWELTPELLEKAGLSEAIVETCKQETEEALGELKQSLKAA